MNYCARPGGFSERRGRETVVRGARTRLDRRLQGGKKRAQIDEEMAEAMAEDRGKEGEGEEEGRNLLSAVNGPGNKATGGRAPPNFRYSAPLPGNLLFRARAPEGAGPFARLTSTLTRLPPRTAARFVLRT